MKRSILTILSIITLATSLSAQNVTMAIKGNSIEGDTQTFVTKMKEKDFSLSGSYKSAPDYRKTAMEEKPITMEGRLLNLKAILNIYGSKLTSTVYKVDAVFNNYYSWDSLLEAYRFINEQFEGKYGKPYSKIEELHNSGSTNTIQSFEKSNKIPSRYETTYLAASGQIIVSIGYQGTSYSSFIGKVTVSYINTDNQKLHEKEVKEQYQSEI